MKSSFYSRGLVNTEFIMVILAIAVTLGVAFSKLSLLIGVIVGFSIPSVFFLIVLFNVHTAKRYEESLNLLRREVEEAHPGTRAKRLSNGQWLLTSQTTGETICEVSWTSS